jgi:hypothetical protein
VVHERGVRPDLHLRGRRHAALRRRGILAGGDRARTAERPLSPRVQQEDFLVLAGECLLLVEAEERHLRAGDFVHCPPGTEHGFVGAGDGACVIFMTGGRTRERRTVYPRSELALRHGAGVEAEATSADEAYAAFPEWQPGRPADLRRLPWGPG